MKMICRCLYMMMLIAWGTLIYFQAKEHTKPAYEKAADFTYTIRNGKSAKLSDITTDYTILFFNSPDCSECAQVKRDMTESTIIYSYLKSKLTVLAVYIDGDIPAWLMASYPKMMINSCDASHDIRDHQLYHITSIPSLYLLDGDKHILLKDTTVKDIESYLTQK